MRRLEADNHQRRLRLPDLQAQLREANDSFDAAGTANRALMGMLNR